MKEKTPGVEEDVSHDNSIVALLNATYACVSSCVSVCVLFTPIFFLQKSFIIFRKVLLSVYEHTHMYEHAHIHISIYH